MRIGHLNIECFQALEHLPLVTAHNPSRAPAAQCPNHNSDQNSDDSGLLQDCAPHHTCRSGGQAGRALREEEAVAVVALVAAVALEQVLRDHMYIGSCCSGGDLEPSVRMLHPSHLLT